MSQVAYELGTEEATGAAQGYELCPAELEERCVIGEVGGVGVVLDLDDVACGIGQRASGLVDQGDALSWVQPAFWNGVRPS